MRHLVGLEIASSAVRVVEINRRLDSEGFATLKAAAMEPLPFDSPVVAGKISDKTAVAHAIREAVRTAGVPRRNVVVGIATDSYSAHLDIPAGAKDHEREFLIRQSDLHMWHVLDRKSARLSWRVVEKYVNGEGNSREILGVAATDSAVIASLEDTLDLAQIRPAAIDLSGAALVRALVRVPLEDRTVQTIVDIGSQQTLVITRVGPHPRSIQTVPVGGKAITDAIGRTLKLAPAAAEDHKRHMEIPRTEGLHTAFGSITGVSPESEKPLSEAEETLASAVDDLVAAIAELVDQDTALHPSMPTQGVLLVGGGSRLRGMRERTAARLGIPVHLGQPWVADKYGKNLEFLQGNRRALADLSVAIGLAMWGIVDRPSADLS